MLCRWQRLEYSRLSASGDKKKRKKKKRLAQLHGNIPKTKLVKSGYVTSDNLFVRSGMIQPFTIQADNSFLCYHSLFWWNLWITCTQQQTVTNNTYGKAKKSTLSPEGNVKLKMAWICGTGWGKTTILAVLCHSLPLHLNRLHKHNQMEHP